MNTVQLPWIEHPVLLISWLEMNKFSAEVYVSLVSTLNGLWENMEFAIENEMQDTGIVPVKRIANELASKLSEIGCGLAAQAALRFAKQANRTWTVERLRIRVDELREYTLSAMGTQLFFWVPTHRADWYSKSAVESISPTFSKRFSSAANEIEEASKCYAFGNYTACVFHLSRATEAGIMAVGVVLKQKKDHETIGRTLKFIEEQTKLNPANQPLVWRTHGEFFATLAGDLRAIQRAWRNKVCHLVNSYDEPRAKEILDASPAFFRHVAEKIDDKGNLY